MKKIIKAAICISCCITLLTINIHWIKHPAKQINYYGETPPLNIPKVFSPGKISDGFANRDMTISPNGDEMFYTIQYPKGSISAIMHVERINGKWTAPEVANFSGRYQDLEAAFSPDGKTIYFSSNRPLTDTGKIKDYDIWTVKKVNGKWTNPQNMGAPVNTEKDEYYAAPTKSGNLYFTRDVGLLKKILLYAFSKMDNLNRQ